MTGFNSVYLDSAPVIYYLDDIAPYNDIVQREIIDRVSSWTRFVSSTILNTEYLVYPLRTAMYEKVAAFDEFKTMLRLEMPFVTDEISYRAALLRAKYRGLKGMDALHIATALQSRCDVFVTNDKQLSQVAEIPVLLLDSMLAGNENG